MITVVDRVRGLLDGVRNGYQRFERRVLAGRMGRWSVRRRWAVLIAVPMLVFCCCGGVLAVPLGWVVHEAVKAGRGAVTPDAAAAEYLMALGYGGDARDELPLMDDEHQDELIRQWQELRATMTAAAMGAPDTLDFTGLTVGPIKDGRATVTTNVSATWWDKGGRATSLSSSPKAWTIETRDDDGWRVSRVITPPWCGAGGYVTQCDQAEPSPPAIVGPGVSPSPSDSLDDLRQMLECGPRDPFRDWHSCPPTPEPGQS